METSEVSLVYELSSRINQPGLPLAIWLGRDIGGFLQQRLPSLI